MNPRNGKMDEFWPGTNVALMDIQIEDEEIPPIWTPKMTARAEGASRAKVIQSKVSFTIFTTPDAICR